MIEWLELAFFSSKKFRKICKFLKEERRSGKNILPQKEDIFKAFALTTFEQVKVVILGQDPYPTAHPIIHAMGLSFSVPDGVKPLPSSLQNIFIELRNDLNVPIAKNGNLTRWAEQGVLLLNTVLTVEEGRPASHKGIGWEILTTEAVRAINEYHKNIVFILWGRHASVKRVLVDTSKHFVITSPHPSPLSAHNGFFGSKPFSKANNYLLSKQINAIKW